MKFIFTLICLLSLPAQASVKGFCQKLLSGLVSSDPYQYESYSRPVLEYLIIELEIKCAWGKLLHREEQDLELMRRELKQRDRGQGQ